VYQNGAKGSERERERGYKARGGKGREGGREREPER